MPLRPHRRALPRALYAKLRARACLASLGLAVFACRGADENRLPGDSTACASLRTRFRDALDRASGACTRDADCDCYDPVAVGLGCGGTTDAATAKRLLAIELEFQASRCAWPSQCAARVCTPKCVEGRCR